MKVHDNLVRRIKKIVALVALVGFLHGCDSKIEGKITKKEIEPERQWVEKNTTYLSRLPPITSEYTLTDDKDFVLYVSRIDGKTDRFYTSEMAYSQYKIGEKVLYNPLDLITSDRIVRKEKIRSAK